MQIVLWKYTNRPTCGGALSAADEDEKNKRK
jgi:hypothetical protein